MTAPLLDPALRAKLLDQLKRAYTESRRASATGALAYLGQVVIDKAGDPCPFREVAESWQWGIAARLAPALDNVAGIRKGYKGPRSFWLTMPRGHDKTSLIGRLSSWILAFSRNPIRGVVGAADKEQASFITEFMQTEARLNPWLDELLKFGNWRVEGINTGSRLKILAADDKSSYGLKEDIHIIEELTHWSKRGLWDAVISGREKRPNSVVIVITNAGVLGTWQRDVFEQIQHDPDWYTYQAPGQLATWMPPERIALLRKLVPPGLAKRLYDNIWVRANEDNNFVTYEEAQGCVDTSLFRRERGIAEHSPYWAGIDYGPVRDRTAMCVLHTEPGANGRVVVDQLDVHQGSADHRVPVTLVEDWIVDVSKKYSPITFVIDPYNLEGTLQRFEHQLDVVRFEPRAGQANHKLAANLRSLIINKQIAWYPHTGSLPVNGRMHDLTDEVAEVSILMKSYGWRLSNDGDTWDDRVVCVGMAALEAVQSQGRILIPHGNRWF